MKICRNCHKQIVDDALVCPYCGCVVKNVRNNGGYQSQQPANRISTHNSYTPANKRKTWLWVIGWIFIFPLPLTVLLLRKRNMIPAVKFGVIAAAWIAYLVIVLAGRSGNTDTSGGTQKNSPSNRSVVSAKTDNNIKSLSFLNFGDLEESVKIGGSTSESYVIADVKNRNIFSPNDVKFVSENPEIATIEFTKDSLTTYLYYKINGISAGETYVYASSVDGSVVSEKMKVIVKGSSENITNMAFADASEVTVKVGQDSNVGTLNVTVNNKGDFSSEDVVFVSENPETATISKEGNSTGQTIKYKIHGIKPGTTNVYVQSSDGKKSSDKICVVVMEPISVEAISFDFEELTLTIGESKEVTANITPDDAENKEIKWSSEDPAVATIDQEGKIVAVAGGSTKITAEASNGIVSSFNVIVDASKRLMNLRVSHPRDDDVNIGSEWSYYNEINGENTKNEYAISVGDTLNFYSRYTESDKDPDVGEASQTYVVTEEDLQNGFTVTMDLYVTENGGRNSGHSAHFVVTYTFSAK